MLNLTSYQRNTYEDEISFFTHQTDQDFSLAIWSVDRGKSSILQHYGAGREIRSATLEDNVAGLLKKKIAQTA